VDSLEKERAILEDSVTELRQLLATQRQHHEELEAGISDFKAQLKAAQDEAMELKTRAETSVRHIEEAKQAHLGAQEQSDVLQEQISRLYDDLKARQANLEQVTAAHDKLAAELKAVQSEEQVRRDLEAKLAAATHAASSEKMSLQVSSRATFQMSSSCAGCTLPAFASACRANFMQGERDMLKVELQQLQSSLRDAQMAYMPIWSHGYYDAARQAVEPALKYHREVCAVLLVPKDR
jgi:chromosome segregation ATPase